MIQQTFLQKKEEDPIYFWAPFCGYRDIMKLCLLK